MDNPEKLATQVTQDEEKCIPSVSLLYPFYIPSVSLLYRVNSVVIDLRMKLLPLVDLIQLLYNVLCIYDSGHDARGQCVCESYADF
jgi:hypothetical protein